MAKQSVKNYLRLDKISRTAHSESAVHGTEALLAGQFVELGAVLDVADRELVEATKAKAGGNFDALIAPVYIDKGFSDFDIQYESVLAGEPGRAIILENGSIISINSELAKGIAKGDNVAIGKDGLGFALAKGENVVVGKCIDIEFEPNVGDLTVIRIYK